MSAILYNPFGHSHVYNIYSIFLIFLYVVAYCLRLFGSAFQQHQLISFIKNGKAQPFSNLNFIVIKKLANPYPFSN